MVTVYKKVEKNTKFLTGTDNYQNGLDIDRPFLFCIGQDNQNNFDLLQKSLIISRVYSANDNGALFKLDDMPIDFISCALNDMSDYDELVNTYIFPYLIAKGNDVNSIKTQAHKMNFLSFSAYGQANYTIIETKLKNILKSKGYNDNDILAIFSQVSLVSLGAPVKNSTNLATSVYFSDVNDNISTDKNPYLKNTLKSSNLNSVCGTLGKNYLYLFNGDGTNSLENYTNINSSAFPRLCSATTYFLENSIDKTKLLVSDSLNTKIPGFETGSDYSIKNLDKSLSYAGASKYNEESINLRRELDASCNQLINQQSKGVDQNINLVLQEIKERCTDTVYYQILAKLGVISNPDPTLMSKKTDRQVINGMLELLDIPYENTKVLTKKED